MNFLIYLILTQGIIQNTAEVWNWINTNGRLGGEFSMSMPGLSWPGSETLNNHYLYAAYFLFGAKENGVAYVRNYQYNYSEWGEGKLLYEGPGISDHDIIVSWHDSLTNTNVPSGEHTGIVVICNSYEWASEPWNDFIAYEFKIVWNKDQCDIPDVGETLDSVMVGIYFDLDISGAASQPWLNDVVSFDGYVAGEWNFLGYPYDSILLLPDTFLNTPDGVYDQYIVYGDDSLEHTIHGDTLILPRNLSYGYDSDGNNGYSDGYVGYALLYAPPSSADTIWIDSYGDTCRIPRVWAHQWWGWECSVPDNDAHWYAYMIGRHPATNNYRFVPPPYDLGAEYHEGLQSSGPFTMADKETLKFVWVAAVGQKMNGGKDTVFGRGWIRGLRQTIDYALAAYYAGSQISDPYHPSAPGEDVHWDISSFGFEEKEVILPTILSSSFWIFLKKRTPIEIIDITGRRIKKYRAIGKVYPFKGIGKGIYVVKLGGKTYKTIVLR